MVDGWSRSGSNGGFQGGCVQRSDQVSNMVVVSGLRANKTGLLGAWILHGTGIGIGISREQVGQIGLLAAWSLSGAVPEILVKWSFWNFRQFLVIREGCLAHGFCMVQRMELESAGNKQVRQDCLPHGVCLGQVRRFW